MYHIAAIRMFSVYMRAWSMTYRSPLGGLPVSITQNVFMATKHMMRVRDEIVTRCSSIFPFIISEAVTTQ